MQRVYVYVICGSDRGWEGGTYRVDSHAAGERDGDVDGVRNRGGGGGDGGRAEREDLGTL